MYSFLKIFKDETDGNNGGTKNIAIKVISIIFLFGIAIGFGFMPYFITSFRKSNKFLSLSNAFSSGILLGIGLFHILPESVEMLEDATKVPLANICCFLSYALILFVEKIAFNSHSIFQAAYCHREVHPYRDNHDQHDHQHHQYFVGKQKEEEQCFKQPENKGETVINKQVLVTKKNQNKENPSSREMEVNPTKSNQLENKLKKQNPITNGGLSSYLLLLNLGFHGLFEGISLGIESEIKGTLFLLLAIALRKWAASLTLGISFVKSGVTKKQFIIMILIFAFITPVGIVFGMTLTFLTSNVVTGIFLSISAGTFIYIACSEVIVDEFSNPENKYIKFLSFLLGAAFAFALTLIEVYTETDHGHHHKHKMIMKTKIKIK